MISQGLTPVFALTYDLDGNMFNTNADTLML